MGSQVKAKARQCAGWIPVEGSFHPGVYKGVGVYKPFGGSLVLTWPYIKLLVYIKLWVPGFLPHTYIKIFPGRAFFNSI